MGPLPKTGFTKKKDGSSGQACGTQSIQGDHMISKLWKLATRTAVVLGFLFTQVVLSQSNNALIDGHVTDSQGAVMSGAKVVLVSKDTAASMTFTTDPTGYFTFPNVLPGTYQLRVTATGFTDFGQDNILVRVGYPVRVNVQMPVAATNEKIEVKENASALNYENAEVRQGIDPQVIEEVPLLVSSGIRSAADFTLILPGITHGEGETRIVNASVNGGQQSAGAVILDGVNLFNSSGIQGLSDAVDFPQSPDIVSEVQVLTSNYDARYTSGFGVLVENVRSGTDRYHGTLYEYNRNSSFNARQWGLPITQAKPENIQNDFGANIGGRFKLPFLGSKVRTYFFGNFEGYRVLGGATRPVLSIPSLQERTGDFSDWIDPNGNLIPVYDPATRQQFMGCNGNQPNVICASDPRLQNSLAKQWFQYLPNPTSPGPVNNYVAPAQPQFLATNAWTYTEKVDAYVGEKDHLSEMFYYKYLPPQDTTELPVPISNSGTSYKKTAVVRVNYDRTFNERLVNHLGFGFQDDGFWGGGVDGNSASKLPQIPGVPSHLYPSAIVFGSIAGLYSTGTVNGFAGYGTDSGSASSQPWLAPAYLVNEVASLTRGNHTISFGGDLRFSKNAWRNLTGQSGTFGFQPSETASSTLTGGSPIASFLLEQVDSATATYYSQTLIDSRQKAFAIFVTDTWHATPKLSINPGIRYEIDPPPLEAHNNFAYLDPNLPNPGAGNLPGAIAFAGKNGAPRYPESKWYGGVAPRLGIAYSVTPNTVVRGGAGIFFDNTNMPSYTGGIYQDGYNTYARWGSSGGGLNAAFLLSNGPPQNYPIPPQLTPTIDNGQSVSIYRPRDGNRLPYSEQWNLTVEHQFTPNDYVSAGYIGNRANRLFSQLNPLNALNPKYLALGPQLYDTFQPGGPTTVDGVNAPFPNFATTMISCAPSVAQALLPYPQYCNGLFGLDENKGTSTYNSFQLKAEHRFSAGMWALLSYTNSKWITDADNAQDQYLGYTYGGYVSPYQPGRRKTLAPNDVPQALNIAWMYQLPFGSGKRWMNHGGIANSIIGGWEFNGVFRAQSGIPFEISSSACTAGAQQTQLQAQCLPGLLPGAHPFLQSETRFDPSKPILNVAGFEPLSSFNFYTGYGRLTQNIRAPGYSDFDIGLQKFFHITEKTTFQLRGDAFNAFNSHHFRQGSFNTDVSNLAGFGTFTGAVSDPRALQVSGRISF